VNDLEDPLALAQMLGSGEDHAELASPVEPGGRVLGRGREGLSGIRVV
jgi:hypothetical protein